MKMNWRKRIFSLALALVMVFQSVPLNVLTAYAEEPDPLTNTLLVNNQPAIGMSVHYGQPLAFSVEGLEGIIEYFYKPYGASDNDWVGIGNGFCLLEPGSYQLAYDYKGISGESSQLGSLTAYSFNVEKAPLAAPGGLSWNGCNPAWQAPTATIDGFALPEGTSVTYSVAIYKGGTQIHTLDNSQTSFTNFENHFTGEADYGSGSYSFAVTALVGENEYFVSSSPSDSSSALSVPMVNTEPGKGIASITAGGIAMPQIMVPGKTEYAFTAEVMPGYTFSSWIAEGIDFGAPNALTTTAKVNAAYTGTSSLTISAEAYDSTPPSIGSFTYEGTTLKATASDGEDGIAAYAFSTAATAAEVTDWISVDSVAAGTKEFSAPLSAGGTYYFHVKDACGNSATSSNCIPATEVRYHSYYNNSVSEDRKDYLVASEVVTFPTPVRTGWEFGGWYSNDTCTESAGTSVNAHRPSGFDFYAKWDKAVLPNLSVDGLNENYQGAPYVLSVKADGTINGILSYDWERDGVSISDAETLSVRNVADSDTYSVTVTLKDADETVIATQTISDISVTILPVELTVTAVDQTLYYHQPVTLSVSADGLVGSDVGTITVGADGKISGPIGGTVTTTYTQGNPVENSPYPITLGEITSANYTITECNDGKVTVLPVEGEVTVELKDPNATYTFEAGKSFTPEVTVKLNGTELESAHYTLAYADHNHAGTATITATLRGNFKGSGSTTFQIGKATYTPTVHMDGWTYGNTANDPSLSEAHDGVVPVYYYASKDSEDFTTARPVDAGEYQVYAQLPETDNYTASKTEKTDFTIAKRQITLTAADDTFTYDGLVHSNTNYTQTGNFAHGEGFYSVTVTGKVKDVTAANVAPNNPVEYKLNSNTHADNYDITCEPGTLKVVPAKLVPPANPGWADTDPGTAVWVPVSRMYLTTSYTLKLYAFDGENDTLVPVDGEDSVTTSDSSYNFAEAIRAFAAAAAGEETPKAYSYRFTVQTNPAGGEAMGNFQSSDPSEKVGQLFTAKVTAVKGEKVASARIGDQESMILLNGETVTAAAEAATGADFLNAIPYTVSANLTVSPEMLSTTQCSVRVTAKLTGSALEETVTFTAQNEYPDLLITRWDYADDTHQSIRLSLSGSDSIGLSAWAIKKGHGSPSDSEWQALPEGTTSVSTGTANITVTEPGEYHFFVKDTDGDWTYSIEPISISKIVFEAGDGGTGTMAPILKVLNQEVRLPVHTFDKEGYAFQNWRGASGIYADEAAYSANPDSKANFTETLTAFWTINQHEYTVEYYLMDTDGNYPAEASSTKTFKAAHGDKKFYNLPSLQLQMTGFTLDDSEGKQTSITVDGTDDTLRIYYKRNQYKLTTTYKKLDGTTDTADQDFYYGASLTDYLTNQKPTADGYTFVGWLFGDTGAEPVTMPAKDVTATGEFRPDNVQYSVRTYIQDLASDGTAAETYTLVSDRNLDDVNADNHALIDPHDFAEEIEGFTYAFAASEAAEPEVSRAAPSNTITNFEAANGQYLCLFYDRNSYNVNLNVWKGNVGTGNKIYTVSIPTLYEAPLSAEALQVYDQSKWPEPGEDYVLAAHVGWSTGDAPTTMPAGDVTITRQYIPKITVGYQVKVYLENANNSYDEKTFTYYGSVGTSVSVGDGADDTIKLSGFKAGIDYFDYYEPVNKEDSKASGIIIDTTNGADSLVLKVYLDRKTIDAAIHYYADGTEVATVTKSAKWGYTFDYEPLAFFGSTVHWNASGELKQPESGPNPEYKGAIQADTFDFLNSNYVVSYIGRYNLGYDTHWTSKNFNSIASLDEPTRHLMGYSNNVVNVYYTSPKPLEMYKVHLVYDPGNLSHCDSSTKELSITHEGVAYDKIYVANQAAFYSDAHFVAEEVPEYPGLAYIAGFVPGENDTQIPNGHFEYTEATLMDGYEKATINSHVCYLDKASKTLYIADTSNPFYKGHFASFNFGYSGANHPGSQTITDFLTNYKNIYPDDPYAQGAHVYGQSFSTVKNDTTDYTLTISFRNGNVYQLSYNLGGTICSDNSHEYAAGTTITPDAIGCSHSIMLHRDGYDIKWYMDSDFTKELESFAINRNTTIYGRYEKQIIKNPVNICYELADPVTVGGTEYKFITEADLSAFDITPEITTGTKNITNEFGVSVPVEITTEVYSSYQGNVVLVTTEAPSMSFENASVSLSGIEDYGLRYDSANPENVLSGYCQAEPLTFRAFFVRDRYTATLDSQIPESNPETTQYRQGQTVTVPDPERGGYSFDGWSWEKADSDTAWTDAPVSKDGVTEFPMPGFHIRAEAQWSAANYEQTIFHYFQNTDRSYSKEKVEELRAEATGTEVTVLWNETEYTGMLTAKGITFQVGEMTYYVVSPPALSKGVYDIHPEKLSAISQTETLLQEADFSVSSHKQTVPFYDFSNVGYQYEADIRTLGENSTVQNQYGQTIDFYYTLQSFNVTTTEVVLAAEGSDSSKVGDGHITLLGSGSYRYGEDALVIAGIPNGYRFLGWYEAGSDTPVSTAEEYRFRVENTKALTAKMQAEPVDVPTVSVSGTTELEYGYTSSADLSITAKAEFGADASSESYVFAYNWYLDGKLQTSHSATFVIPAGWNAGDHTVRCEVITARKDNGVQESTWSQDFTVDVKPQTLSYYTFASGVETVYDGDSHSITLDILGQELNEDDYEVYYSLTELTEENYNTVGSTKNIGLKDVKHDGNGTALPYTVYYYVHSKSPNYTDYPGSAEILITPKRLTLSRGTAYYSKTYDGYAEVLGDINDSDSDFYKLVRNTNLYSINGLVSADEMNTYIISCEAKFNSRHAAEAHVVEMRDIILANNAGDRVYNYDFDPTFTMFLSGYIIQRELDLTWDKTEFIYDAQPHLPTPSFPGTLPEPDSGKLTLTASGSQVNAGEYVAYARLTSAASDTDTYASDYILKNDGIQSFTIQPRPVTIAMKSEAVNYDQGEHTLTEFLDATDPKTDDSGILEGHTFTAAASVSYTNAGEYNIAPSSVVILDDHKVNVTGNYEITKSGSGVLTIKALPVTVGNIAGVEKDYDGTTAAALNLENVSFGGILTGDSLALDPGKMTYAFTDANAGTNKTISISYQEGALTGASAGNYYLADDSQPSASAEIRKLTLTVKAENVRVTYGEDCSFAALYDGFLTGEGTEKVQGTPSFMVGTSPETAQPYSKTLAAGTYFIYPDVSGLSADNYTFTPVNTGKLTVEPRPIVVKTAENAMLKKPYDGTKDVTTALASGTHYTFTVDSKHPERPSGIVNGDTVTLKEYTAAYDERDVGSNRTVTVTGMTLTSGNYTLVNDSIIIPGEITQSTLKVKVTPITQEYGYYTDTNRPDFTVTYDGFGTGDDEASLGGTLEFACDFDPTKPEYRKVRAYEITASGLTSGNYKIEYVPEYLTITPAKITITANASPAALEYGTSEMPVFDYTPSGFRYEDTASVISGTVTYTHKLKTANDGSKNVISCPAGDYTIMPVVTGLSSENYSFEAAGCKVTVAKKNLTVNGIGGGTKVYDGTDAVLSTQLVFTVITYDGLLSFDRTALTEAALRDPLTNNILTISDAKYADGHKDVDTDLPITFTLGFGEYLSQRYAVNNNQSSATANITKRPLLIQAKDKQIYYGQDAPTFTAEFLPTTDTPSGLVEGETPTETIPFTCDYTNEEGKISPVGTYEIWPVIPSKADQNVLKNYEMTTAKGTLAVLDHRLAAPVSSWDTGTPGKVTWDAVDGIGDVAVASYSVQLKKDGTAIGSPVSVAADGDLSCYFLETIRENGAGAYTAAVTAIASETKNAGKVNVQDSAQGTDTDEVLHAAEVSFVFAGDNITQGGMGDTIQIHGDSSYVVVEGETDIPIAATLKNATGYTIKSVKGLSSSGSTISALTVDKANDSGRTEAGYASTIGLTRDYGSSEPIRVTLELAARKATLRVTVEPVAGSSNKTIYGYVADQAPHFKAIVAHSDDPQPVGGYEYSYQWVFKKSLSKEPQNSVLGTPNEWVFPLGQAANTKADYYGIGCIVTATRKDNGQSIEVGRNVFSNIIVNRANFTVSVSMANWTYGEQRNAPVLSPSVTPDQNPQLKHVEYTYSSDNGATWRSTFPTDAGTYKVRAKVPVDNNYEEKVAEAPFQILPSKLEDPSLIVESTESIWAQLAFASANPPVENNGQTGSASRITPKYQVALYKDDTLVKDYDTISATTQDITNEIKDGGLFRAKVTAISDNQNNCADSETATLNINANVAIAANRDIPFTYDKDGTIITVTATGLDSNVSEYLWYKDGKLVNTTTEPQMALKNVADSGSYVCVLKLENGNVAFTRSLPITINKRPVTLTSATEGKIYDGTALTNDEVTVSGAEFVEGEGATYSVTGSQTNAGGSNGNNAFTYTLNDNTLPNNYAITKVCGTLTVTPKSLDDTDTIVAALDAANEVYNGQEHTPTASVTYSPVGKNPLTLAVGSDFTVVYSNNINAGENTASATITGTGNYQGSVTLPFTIAPKNIGDPEVFAELALAANGEVYDGKQHTPQVQNAVYTPSELPSRSLTQGTDADQQDFTVSYGENINATTDSAKATVTLTGHGNYTGTKVLEFPIFKRSLEITAKTDSKIYDGTPLTYAGAALTGDEYSITGGTSLADGHELTVYAEGTITDVLYNGTAVIGTANKIKKSEIVIKAGNTVVTDNYAITCVDGTLTILPKDIGDLDLSAGQKMITALLPEANETFNGQAHTPAASVTYSPTADRTLPVLESGTNGFTVEYQDNVLAGTAKAILTGHGNYKGTTELTFPIAKKVVELNWTDRALTYNGENQKPNATVTNAAAGSPCTVTVTGEQKDANTADASAYIATATALSDPDNYQLPDNASTTFTIAPRAVTLRAENKSSVYGDNIAALTYVQEPANTILEKDLEGLEIQLSTEASPVKHVGNCDITVSYKPSRNYSISTEKGTYTITQREVTLTWDNTELTYNGQPQKPTATAGNLVNGDTCNVTVEGARKDANTHVEDVYIASAKTLDNENYKLPTAVTQTFKIIPISVTLQADNKSSIYKEAMAPLTYTEIPENAILTDDVESLDIQLTTAAAVGASVGTYPIRLTYTPSRNYAVNVLDGTVSGSEYGFYTITDATIQYTVTAYDQPYDGAAHGIAVNVTTPVSGAKIYYSTTPLNSRADLTAEMLTPVTYQDFTDGAKTVYYYIVADNYADVKGSSTVNISKRSLEVTAKSADRVYNGQELTINGYVETLNPNLANGETMTVTNTGKIINVAYDSAGQVTSVPNPIGTVVIRKGTTDVTGNYAITTNDGSLRIDPMDISNADLVTASLADNETYTGEAHTPAAAASYKPFSDQPALPLAEGTDKDFTVTYANNVNATTDSSKASATLTGRGNYTGTRVLYFDIAQREVTLTWANTALTYNGQNQKPTVTTGNLAGNDTCLVTAITGEEKDANTADVPAYTATAAALDNPNYKLPANASTPFTIAPRVVTLRAANKESIYGNAIEPLTYAQEPAGTILNDDLASLKVQLTTAATSSSNVGTYGITLSYTPSRNYTVTPVNAVYTITQREVTLTWADTELTYNGQPQKPTATAGNLANGDSVTVTVTGEQTNANTAATPTYTAAADALSSNNYKLPNAVTQTFKILPKAAEITVKDSEKVYGEKDPAFTGTVTGLVADTDLGTVTYRRIGTDENAGTYKEVLTASYTANPNYTVTLKKADFRIQPAPGMTVAGKDVTEVYDGKYHGEAAASNVTAGTTIQYSTDNGATWSTTVPTVKDAGTVKVQVKAVNPNYVEAAGTYTLTITPKPLTITPNSLQKIYGDNDPQLTAVVDGLVDGDTVAYTLNRKDGKDVGTYAITVWVAADQYPNYDITLGAGSLTIQPKDISKGTATLGEQIVSDKGWEQVVSKVTVDGLTATWTVSGNTMAQPGSQTMTIQGTGNFTGTLKLPWAGEIPEEPTTEPSEEPLPTEPHTPPEKDIVCLFHWLQILLLIVYAIAAFLLRAKKWGWRLAAYGVDVILSLIIRLIGYCHLDGLFFIGQILLAAAILLLVHKYRQEEEEEQAAGAAV